MKRTIFHFFVLFAFTSMAMAGDRQTLETVSQVNLERYFGTWYELARLPNRFQQQCVGNVTADYTQLDSGEIEVVNRCLEESGRLDEARGVARIVDSETNAKLEVSFVSLFGLNLFWGDYWVLDLGEDYEYAVVGEPSRDYAWILSRTIQLSPAVWSHIQQVLVRSGYDPERLVKTRQEESPKTP